MREIYFGDKIDDREYSGKLYGFGQTFPNTNGLDPGRGGATIAEREDRGIHQTHTPTPGQINAIAQTPGVSMGIPMPIPTPLPNGGYGPLAANGYMRPSLVGGGR